MVATHDHLSACNRFQLPDALPPSFKGTAVKYAYHLEAHARFATAAVMPSHQRQPSGSSVGSDSMQVSDDSMHEPIRADLDGISPFAC